MKKTYSFFLLSITCLLCQCNIDKNGKVIIPDKPYSKLSEYNFFNGKMADLNPNEGVLPYDLNSPLFSDYASKARFVWMPKGTAANYTTDHALDFPVGTALIKNFYYNNDDTNLDKGKRFIETRMLLNRGEEWEALGYIWNEEQTEARYEIIGDIQEVSWIDEMGEDQSANYIIPNKNQCKNCHAFDNKQMPIGPKVANLNKNFDYVDGTMNQLEKWAAVGYLNGYDSTAVHPSVAVWDDEKKYKLHDRAMAYLDINCGHCHNPQGAANTSGLTLLADSEMGLPLGIYKATVSAGAGTGGNTYSIVPGDPDKSILVYRMKSSDPGAMMPELGRQLIHKEGVSLISSWIENMEVSEDLKPRVESLN